MSAFKKGTVVISVDDGRFDAYCLFKEILEPLALPATFNIVTGWVSDSDDLPRSSVSCKELAEMAASPLVEIAGHGHTHRNDDEDIIQGHDVLCEWLQTDDALGFASPGSRMKADFVAENAAALAAMGYLYVRSVDVEAGNSARHTQAVARAKAAGCSDYVAEMLPRVSYGYEGMFVNSAVVFFSTAVEDVKQLTEFAMEEQACLVLMFYSVKKKGAVGYDDMYSYDYDQFKDLATYWSRLRAAGKLDVLTNKEAYFIGSGTEAVE